MKLNVLVYSGSGTTAASVKQCVETFRDLLLPFYAVATVDASVLVSEPWEPTCALLCIPGGADLGFCRALNGIGNRKIAQYVRQGGRYIGFCAGGYYASRTVEFEEGNRALEVTGRRELGFYPGICRGTAFKGFQYDSEVGARASRLLVDSKLCDIGAPQAFRSYYNGGGVFVDAERFEDAGVDILAQYEDDVEVESGSRRAAVVLCKVGNGHAILTGTHPEFCMTRMRRNDQTTKFIEVKRALEDDNSLRIRFLISCLKLLDIRVNLLWKDSPKLTVLHISSLNSQEISKLLEDLQEVIERNDDSKQTYGFIKGENDTFVLKGKNNIDGTEYLPSKHSLSQHIEKDNNILNVIFHTQSVSHTDTPYFDHIKYFDWLRKFRSQYLNSLGYFGSPVMYGEVVTSTNTLLDKNFKILQKLSSGFVAVGTVQIAGRGRGTNSWVSPVGSLMFSLVLRYRLQNKQHSRVIFVQYLVALAIANAVKNYDKGYDAVLVRLKWPNDIYIRHQSPENNSTTSQDINAYLKIGGILVNSTFCRDEFVLVIGCGINTQNEAPTTSLNLVLDAVNKERKQKNLPQLASYEQEKLLARILVTFEQYYNGFQVHGFQPFLDEYYKLWLHSGQVVSIETEGNSRARIRGIELNEGMLEAEEVNALDNPTGKIFNLQTDNNSFDFFKGLLKRKT